MLLTSLGHPQPSAPSTRTKGKLSGFHPQLHKTTGICSLTPARHKPRLYKPRVYPKQFFPAQENRGSLAEGQALLLCARQLSCKPPRAALQMAKILFFYILLSSISLRWSHRRRMAQLWRPRMGLTGTGLAVLMVWEIPPTPSQMFLQTLQLMEMTPQMNIWLCLYQHCFNCSCKVL